MTVHSTFSNLGIAPGLLKRLDELKFITPTPIQYKSIPIGIKGEDVIGIAQTGTGKTLAFSIPLIQRLSSTKQKGLILCPTRELAIQVNETLKKIGMSFGLKTVVIIGGAKMHRQIMQLKGQPHVIVATPGRLIDHMDKKTVKLDRVGIMILDEADRMLDMGFGPQIRRIFSSLPIKRQTMLFSATMPEKISKIARQYMAKPLRVEVAPSGTTAEQVEQELFVVPRSQKMELLEQLLQEYTGTILVFSRTKYGAKKISKNIKQMGHTSTELHSNRTLSQRRQALDGFKSGRYRVLVATDIASRGIDVTDIELVINFDLPENSEDYVHRVGRTGRAESTGRAISFACPEQSRDVMAIERLINIRLPIRALPGHMKGKAMLTQSNKSPERKQRPHGRNSSKGSFRRRGGRRR